MPVTLQNPNRVATPSWLTDTSSSQQLTDTYNQLPQMFDTSGLKSASDAFNQNFANRAEMGFDAQARGAENRAMLNGGRVGASFAKGGLMLGLQGNLMQNNLDFAKLAAQMKAQQAGLAGQLAGNIADYGQRQQGMRSDFTQGQQRMRLQAGMANQSTALEQQRLAQQASQFAASQSQQNNQFGQSLDLQKQQLQGNLANDAAQRASLALRLMGPGNFNYSTDMGGTPISATDAQQMYRAQQYQQQRQNLLGTISRGF